MAEYWKSTPRYWCKHCSVYIRDTKLERANHESTARHQGNLKRALRDLHRGHEREERDKERAKREVDRLNGIVSTPGSFLYTAGCGVGSTSSSLRTTSALQLQHQRDQLLDMGITIPDTSQPATAGPGEWTVTNTRVLKDPRASQSEGREEDEKVEARATGVRKRDVTEEQKEEEEAVRGLFKKPRRWGRDSKTLPAKDDEDLDALLSGTLSPTAKRQETEENNSDNQVKRETNEVNGQVALEGETSVGIRQSRAAPVIKPEPDSAFEGVQGNSNPTLSTIPSLETKTEEAEDNGVDSVAPAVVFKKRKPKGIRMR